MSALGPRLRAALLAGRRRGRRGTGATSLRRSDGYEFAELREYVEGDDPRRIDWAATARAGALQTRVILEERSLFLGVAIDASASMEVGRTRSLASLAHDAAATWFGAAIDDDRCAALTDRPLVLRTVRGRTGAHAALAHVSLSTRGSLAQAMRYALALLPRDARLLVVSDFYELDEYADLLRACAERFDLTALFARDPWRDGLPLGGFVRLRDAESGRVASAYVTRAGRARFKTAVERRERSVLERLQGCGARTGTLDESAGADAALAGAFAL